MLRHVIVQETALAEDDDWTSETTAEPDTAEAAPMSDSDDDVIVLPSYPTPSQAARACKTGSGSGPAKAHRVRYALFFIHGVHYSTCMMSCGVCCRDIHSLSC